MIALARTGVVSLFTIFSEMFPPSRNNLIEMRKYDLLDLAPQTRRTVVVELLDYVETLREQPILALRTHLDQLQVCVVPPLGAVPLLLPPRKTLATGIDWRR